MADPHLLAPEELAHIRDHGGIWPTEALLGHIAALEAQAVVAMKAATAAEQHDARIRAEGRKAGLEEALSILSVYIDQQPRIEGATWHYEWLAAIARIRTLVNAPKEAVP